MAVKIGFIGCGHHATHNLYPALRFADCELLAAADLHAERRDHVRRAFGAQRLYHDYRDLLANETELDAVFVVGPPTLHHEATLAALECGLPVFVEKPPAPSLKETEEIAAAARRAGRFVMVGFMKRFAQKYQLAMELSRRPDFGTISHMFMRYSYNTKGDAERMLAMMSVHALDLMRFFMGDIQRMHVERGTIEGTTNFTITMLFKSGATGSLVMNNRCAGVLERVELTGTGGFIVVNEVQELAFYPANDQAWVPPVKTVYAPNTALQTTDNDSLELQGYRGEVMVFIAAVKSNTPPPMSTIDDGVAAMRLVEVLARTPSGTIEC